MRKWRIGTITLGFTLLIVGAGLIYARINAFQAFDIILQWWPLAFIALGLEVLAQYYFNRNGEERMRYDLLSMFIILLVVVSGLGLEFISDSGLKERLEKELVSSYYTITMPTQEFAVPAGVSRIVINTSDIDMDIHTTAVPNCTISSQVTVRNPSYEEAALLVEQQKLLNTRIAGDVLYIEANSSVGEYVYREKQSSILLPENLAVEIQNDGIGSIHYYASGTGQPLSISGNGTVSLFLPATADVNIRALAYSESFAPTGNLSWTSRIIDGPAPVNTPATSSSDMPAATSNAANGQDYHGDGQNMNQNSAERQPTFEYQATLGKGSTPIRLINSNSLEIIVQ